MTYCDLESLMMNMIVLLNVMTVLKIILPRYLVAQIVHRVRRVVHRQTVRPCVVHVVLDELKLVMSMIIRVMIAIVVQLHKLEIRSVCLVVLVCLNQSQAKERANHANRVLGVIR